MLTIKVFPRIDEWSKEFNASITWEDEDGHYWHVYAKVAGYLRVKSEFEGVMRYGIIDPRTSLLKL